MLWRGVKQLLKANTLRTQIMLLQKSRATFRVRNREGRTLFFNCGVVLEWGRGRPQDGSSCLIKIPFSEFTSCCNKSCSPGAGINNEKPTSGNSPTSSCKVIVFFPTLVVTTLWKVLFVNFTKDFLSPTSRLLWNDKQPHEGEIL